MSLVTKNSAVPFRNPTALSRPVGFFQSQFSPNFLQKKLTPFICLLDNNLHHDEQRSQHFLHDQRLVNK
jgi:hypothetical protein